MNGTHPVTPRRDFLRWTAAGLATLGVAGCGGDGGSGGGAITLGALYPLSGDLALLGEESWRGAEIARKRRNEQGGIAGREVTYTRADVPDVNAATAEARRLVTQQGLQFLLGTYSSSLCLAASEVAARSGASYFELGAIANDITERGYDSVFRTCPPAATFTEVQMAFIGDWLAAELDTDIGDLNVAFVHEDSAYGSSIVRTAREQAQQAGLRIGDVQPYDSSSTDLSSIVLNLRQAEPDVVIAVSYAQDAILLGRQIQEVGLRIPAFIGTGGGHSLADFHEALGDAVEGVLNVDFTQYNVDTSFTPGLDDFVTYYQEEFGSQPRSGHSLANFMGANIVFDILQETDGDLDPAAVAEVARGFEVAQGESATGWGVSFDETGQNERAKPYVMQWRDGEMVTVWPEDAALEQPELVTPFAG